MRYTGWRRLSGDTAARPDLLDLGKRLLGYLEQRRKLGAPKTLAIQRQLPDGSIVQARFDADIPSIYVLAAPGQAESPQEEPPGGFVVTPKGTMSDGALPLVLKIDTAHPQLILQPTGKARWKTWFESRDIAANALSLGYKDFSGSKSTYGRLYPQGLLHGGNIEWKGQDGVRLNWIGPSRRYWFDCFRATYEQYASTVAMNGVVLLDLLQYAADNDAQVAETYIVGAAMRGRWLYVMQAALGTLDFGINLPPGPITGNNACYSWISPPYPDGDNSLRLARYEVERGPTQGTPTYQIVPKSRETLWTHTGRGWVNPWSFAPDGLRCETFAMPDELRCIQFNDRFDGEGQPYTDGNLDMPPSTSSQHCTINIDHVEGSADASFTTLSTPTFYDDSNITSTVIAADYDASGNRVTLSIGGLAEVVADPQVWLSMPGVPDIPIQQGPANDRLKRSCEILWVDLRERVVVLNRRDEAKWAIEIHRAGKLVATVPTDNGIGARISNIFSRSAFAWDVAGSDTAWAAQRMAQATVSPLFKLLGVDVIGTFYGYDSVIDNKEVGLSAFRYRPGNKSYLLYGYPRGRDRSFSGAPSSSPGTAGGFRMLPDNFTDTAFRTTPVPEAIDPIYYGGDAGTPSLTSVAWSDRAIVMSTVTRIAVSQAVAIGPASYFHGQSLTQLTGMSNPGYGDLPFNYEPMCTPIWQIGTWPSLKEPEQ